MPEEITRAKHGDQPEDFRMPEDAEPETLEALPEQEEFWRPPVRFGSIPVEKEPLGWDRKKGFEKLFPRVKLPFQIVERVSFGNRELEPNRLIWGDNLHVMRQLPSESIDLIYIDPPFFSGRQYLRRPERGALVFGHLGGRHARLPHLAERPPVRNEAPAQKDGQHLCPLRLARQPLHQGGDG